MNSYDIAIIGSGPGGYVAAIRAAQLNLKTVLIEKDRLGGVCLNWGCIPTKALLKSAELFEQIKKAKSFGITVKEAAVDFPAVIKRSRQVADMNSKGVEFLMKKNKIDVEFGSARFQTANQLEVTDASGKTKRIEAKHIIIATGGRPRTIPGIEIDEEKIISSRTAMTLKEKPASMVIIGAGAIGVEFAYFYNAMGSAVTMVEMLDHLLPQEDEEISTILERNFKKNKINFHTSATVSKIEKLERGVRVFIKKGDKEEVLEADKALMAIGIQGNVEGLGLEKIGVEHEKGFIKVDQWYRTNVDGVYAIGDIIGPPLLAHVASHEGIVCVEKIAGLTPHAVDYNSIPGCTYCQPQVASIGLTEKEALAQGNQIKIGRFPYSASGKARAIGERDGMVKLIFDAKYGELLGAHIIGAEATELIAELGVAKGLEVTPVELFSTIHAHPTLSEMIMEAAADAEKKAIHI
ncbi:dihydrolipoyl dehydrogenase [Caldithrix abyssi]